MSLAKIVKQFTKGLTAPKSDGGDRSRKSRGSGL